MTAQEHVTSQLRTPAAELLRRLRAAAMAAHITRRTYTVMNPTLRRRGAKFEQSQQGTHT
jgi:hypothetical protein